MDKTTAKAIKRLGNHYLLVGTMLRRKGAMALVGTAVPEAVMPLFDALKDKQEKVRGAAYLALTKLRGRALDRFCGLWEKHREETLRNIVVNSGYVASKPWLLIVRTSFLQGKKVSAGLASDIVEACLLDQDQSIFEGAVNYVLESTEAKGHDSLWGFSMEHPASRVPACLHKKKWYPQDPSERALFYFLADAPDSYHDLDFERAYLRTWYETGSSVLRDAIASRIRKSGDTRLLAVFKTERGGRKTALSEKEVDLQIEIRRKNRDYPELFRLLPFSTYDQGVRIIAGLTEGGWENPESHSRALQIRIEGVIFHKEEDQNRWSSDAMTIYQDFRPMFLGKEKPPEDDAGLLSWVEDKGDFRRRSSALIVMAEKDGSNISDAANTACGDDYWQVRMAAAAAEMLRPGTLSPANKALLEQDHVYWVQALLNLARGNRLCDLGPADLDVLNSERRLSGPDRKPDNADGFLDRIKGDKRTPEEKYLLALGEYLGTDAVVSEDISYDAGETDVEIEMDE